MKTKRFSGKRVIPHVKRLLDAQRELSEVATKAVRCAGYGEKPPTKRLIAATIRAHIAYVRYNRFNNKYAKHFKEDINADQHSSNAG